MTRWQRWCGICFAWREETDGRCTSCGNAHMTGDRLPLASIASSGEEKSV